ncbi:MAG: EAL domain-containing protein [Microthrixaceae bacterium]
MDVPVVGERQVAAPEGPGDAPGSSPRAVPGLDLAALGAALPDPTVVFDEDARVLWGNPAAERFFGIPFDSHVEMSATGLIHPHDLDLVAVSLVSVRDKQVGTPIELRLRSTTGWRLTEVVGARWGDRLVVTIRDLTDRRCWEVASNQDARLRSIVHNSSMITMLVDRDGIVTDASGALTRLLGHDPEQVVGDAVTRLLTPATGAKVEALLAAAQGSGADEQAVRVDVELVSANGLPVPFALTITNLLDDPTVGRFVVDALDIRDRVAAEAALRGANAALRATLESTAEGILVESVAGAVSSRNQRLLEMWGLDERDLERRVPWSLIGSRLTNAGTLDAVLAQVARYPTSDARALLELRDGRVFESESAPQVVDEVVIGRVWTFRDITAERNLQDELRHQAFHDSLTALPNKALFRDRLDLVLRGLDRRGGCVAVAFIDLDNFKTVNDSLGHHVGDELLMIVADRLRLCIRDNDTAARLGGDEFAVMMDRIDNEAEAAVIGQRIVEALAEPMVIGDQLVSGGASLGLACTTPEVGLDANELLRNADLAMYAAKARGRGRLAHYEPSMHSEAVARLGLEAALRGAVARGELSLAYQPILDTTARRWCAAEALARWNHPERGSVPPSLFIEVAESSGLIDEIGEFVLDTALGTARRWIDEFGVERAPVMHVNLSPRQLLNAAVVTRVSAALALHGVDPSFLVLEITEGALISDPVLAARRLSELSELGIRLAVDDFGTGYSSLSYLHQFPIDILKIDGSFVDRLLLPEQGPMVEAIVRLAHILGLSAVAEGVESEPQNRRLAELGCDQVQGYHLARPMSAPDAAALMWTEPPAGANWCS